MEQSSVHLGGLRIRVALSKPAHHTFSFSVPPEISAQEQLVGAAFGEEAVARCFTRAYPQPMVFWTHGMRLFNHFSTTRMGVCNY